MRLCRQNGLRLYVCGGWREGGNLHGLMERRPPCPLRVVKVGQGLDDGDDDDDDDDDDALSAQWEGMEERGRDGRWGERRRQYCIQVFFLKIATRVAIRVEPVFSYVPHDAPSLQNHDIAHRSAAVICLLPAYISRRYCASLSPARVFLWASACAVALHG